MSNFASIERNYYTPRDDSAWDRFVEASGDAGIEPLEEDFDHWLEMEAEARAEEQAEQFYDYLRERDIEV